MPLRDSPMAAGLRPAARRRKKPMPLASIRTGPAQWNRKRTGKRPQNTPIGDGLPYPKTPGKSNGYPCPTPKNNFLRPKNAINSDKNPVSCRKTKKNRSIVFFVGKTPPYSPTPVAIPPEKSSIPARDFHGPPRKKRPKNTRPRNPRTR